jgi:glucose/arabinose dehydrogenase
MKLQAIVIASRFLFVVFLTACAAPTPAVSSIHNLVTTDPSTGLALPPGYRSEVVANGLDLPTHVAVGPDQALYLTQLNGAENEGKGQIVRVSSPGAAPEVVLERLYKPTGLSWAAGALYIVSGNGILVSREKDGKLDTPSVLFKDLPFNGRSNGQIATGPDGLLYFQSTGNEGKSRESGFIYTAKPDGSEFKVYARGLKNAYAMTWDATGKMFTTEIGDGIIEGVGQFPEELNVIHRGGDYGWPFCYANQKENRAIGGNRNICADTDRPIALFPPSSTPTGLAFVDGRLIVALWNGNPPRLLSVDPNSGEVSEFASGFKRPIALLAAPGGGLLVVDMDAGLLYRLYKTT